MLVLMGPDTGGGVVGGLVGWAASLPRMGMRLWDQVHPRKADVGLFLDVAFEVASRICTGLVSVSSLSSHCLSVGRAKSPTRTFATLYNRVL